MSDSRLLSRKRFFPTYLPFAALTLFCAVFSLASCTFGSGGSTDSSTETTTVTCIVPTSSATSANTGGDSGTPIYSVDFGSASSKTVDLSGLAGHSVFLVKVNTSSSSVSASSTGSASASTANGIEESFSSVAVDNPARYFSESAVSRAVSASGDSGGVISVVPTAIQEFNADPPTMTKTSSSSGLSRLASSTIDSSDSNISQSYVAGSTTTTFWITDNESSPYTWEEKSATLCYTGSYCYVYVADDNLTTTTATGDDKITSAEAATLGSKFDSIYPVETGLLGYEYGGDSSKTSTYGGYDADPKICIFVYDLFNDSATTIASRSGTLGFFWSKDEYDAESFTADGVAYKSNQAEMFYIDSAFTDDYPEYIYSTLAHEFQHMIQYNKKVKEQNLNASGTTWYNEMMSMMTEEVIGKKLGFNESGLPWNARASLLAGCYDWYGLTDFSSTISYSIAYGFGTYLLHNYGGAALLAAMESNDTVGTASVLSAVNSVNSSSYTFADLAKTYGKALLFGVKGSSYNLPSGIPTFYSDTCSSSTYPLATNHNIESVSNYLAGLGQVQYATNQYYEVPSGAKGITIYPLSYTFALPAYTSSVFSDDSWQNINADGSGDGNFSVTLTKPSSSNVSMYLVVR